jgi:16S rRNA (guanine527-N7)-methyltransferase
MDISVINKLLVSHKDQFELYRNLLIKWNKIHNLTSITDPDEIWEKHFLDSIAPLPFLSPRSSLLDIGSGAGFPGIPLKIVSPDLYVILIESRQKKCSFCDACIRELGLKNIAVEWKRIGRHSHPPIRPLPSREGEINLRKFDVIISRATFKLSEFLQMSLPFIKSGGIIIAMKSENIENELKDAENASPNNIKLKSLENYILPVSKAKRSLIIFESD